jgi:WD40 repeat protein
MRRLAIMCFMLVFFLFPLPIRALAQDTQTYTTKDGLLSFGYPDGWIVEDSNDLYVVVANGYGVLAALTVDASLFAEGDMAILLLPPSVLDQFIKVRLDPPVTPLSVTNMLTEANPFGPHFSEPRSTTVNGHPAVRVESSIASIDIISYVIELEPGQFVAFDLYSYQGEALQNEPAFLDIAATFRFNASPELSSHGIYDYTIDGLAFSPDGKLVTRGVGYRGLLVLDGETGDYIDVAETPDLGLLGNIVFRPDATYLVSGRVSDPEGVRVWDSRADDNIFTFTQDDLIWWEANISPDLTRLAAVAWSEDLASVVYLWDLTTGDLLYTKEFPPSDDETLEPLIQAVFNPDGTRLAVAGRDYPIWIWDAATGEELVTIEGTQTGVMSLTFSPDGTLLAACSREPTSAIFVWDVATGKKAVVLRGHSDTVKDAVFSADGRLLASASDDQTVRLWDVKEGSERAVLTGHRNKVEIVTFNADGTRLASGDQDGVLKIWDVERAMED